jgi:hypothetical protein
MTHDASWLVRFGLAGIPAAVAVLIAWGYARAGRARGEPGRTRGLRFAGALGALGLWMAAAAVAAGSGALQDFARRPPPLMLAMLASVGAALALALSPIGARFVRGLPMAALVAAQGFRLPLELCMHRAAREGVMPVQMSFAGLNFDILTGASALVIAALLATGRAPRALVVAWNAAGALLLANISAVAVASTPLFHAFGTAPERLNTFVTELPFVWLPTVLVPVALAGHVIVARKLAAGARVPATAESG